MHVGMTLKEMGQLTVEHRQPSRLLRRGDVRPFLPAPAQRLEPGKVGALAECRSAAGSSAARTSARPASAGSSSTRTSPRTCQRDAALEEEHTRFSAALDSMSHGLSMYDGELNLVVCNQRYCDIYGVPAELAKPGTPLKVMLAAPRGERCHADRRSRRMTSSSTFLRRRSRQKARVQTYRLAQRPDRVGDADADATRRLRRPPPGHHRGHRAARGGAAQRSRNRAAEHALRRCGQQHDAKASACSTATSGW